MRRHGWPEWDLLTLAQSKLPVLPSLKMPLGASAPVAKWHRQGDQWCYFLVLGREVEDLGQHVFPPMALFDYYQRIIRLPEEGQDLNRPRGGETSSSWEFGMSRRRKGNGFRVGGSCVGGSRGALIVSGVADKRVDCLEVEGDGWREISKPNSLTGAFLIGSVGLSERVNISTIGRGGKILFVWRNVLLEESLNKSF